MSRIYIASSWKNKFQQQLVEELRKRGHKVYDFKHPYGRNDVPVWESVSVTQNLRSAYVEKCLKGKDFKRMLLDRQSIKRFEEHRMRTPVFCCCLPGVPRISRPVT